MQARPIELVGQKFGRLTVQGAVPSTMKWQRMWNVLCDCGNTLTVGTGHLRSGNTRSCGCLKREATQRMGRARLGKGKHALARTPEYRVWQTMRLRCQVPSNRAFKNYGARGIYVCERWRQSVADFIADMGCKPTEHHEIDRINNDGSYTCGKCPECATRGAPMNCRWVTRAENSRNRRSNRLIEHSGETLTLIEWSQRLGISASTIAARLALGWSTEKALSTPARQWVRKTTRAAA